MRLSVIFAILLAMTLFGSVKAAEGPDANLIRREMIALDKAFKTAIDAVVLNKFDKVAPAFEEVRKIRIEFEKAVRSGKKIPLPKNQERFKIFVKFDDRFHGNVDILVEAAKRDRMPLVYRQTVKLYSMCVKCHSVFRK